MSNKEEWNRILQIVGEEGYPTDSEFADKCVKKFSVMRNLFYVILFGGSFYIIQGGRIIPNNDLVFQGVMAAIIISAFAYIKQKKVLHLELNRYAFRECWPDKGLSRYLSFVPTALRKQMLWSVTQYNFGCILFRLGRIDKAAKCLALMQESSTTAYNMLLALHLKHYIALYYNDYDTVISSANEATVIYPKVRHTTWNNKIFGDLQMYGAYANCFKNNAPQQVYSVLQSPQERPMDEVERQYYLYRAAIVLNDLESAERFKRYVMDNAGTTWYGQAVRENFVPESKPVNYPGYIIRTEMLNSPSKVDNSRLKYMLLGVLIVLLFYIVPRLL